MRRIFRAKSADTPEDKHSWKTHIYMRKGTGCEATDEPNAFGAGFILLEWSACSREVFTDA
jgi:hypothetical protein